MKRKVAVISVVTVIALAIAAFWALPKTDFYKELVARQQGYLTRDLAREKVDEDRLLGTRCMLLVVNMSLDFPYPNDRQDRTTRSLLEQSLNFARALTGAGLLKGEQRVTEGSREFARFWVADPADAGMENKKEYSYIFRPHSQVHGGGHYASFIIGKPKLQQVMATSANKRVAMAQSLIGYAPTQKHATLEPLFAAWIEKNPDMQKIYPEMTREQFDRVKKLRVGYLNFENNGSGWFFRGFIDGFEGGCP